MMTRAQQKELLASLDELSALLRQIDWEDAEQREVASSCLSTADDVCRENLSAARAAVYHEVFDGLLTIVRKTDWIGMPQKEQEQVRQLMTEILASGISALRKEKEIKKILVFLPYKASMWDSLESVWRAAAQDKERCETYVVPIPYCDRNPDTSAAAWHCEAPIFPKDVPVCDWRDFTLEKLEAMHPDVIFIHNPYDNYNLVTSVDSQYYSHNLKKCTDNLVYIPYFVTGHTIAPHFCQMPGVVNADHVIVENEDIKAAYEQNYPGGNPPKGKFLALGSPKYDAVLSHKREDYVLPEKWQKITEGRKIVLYNTSLTAMLQNSQYVCRKLRYVFSLFKGRKDIALWWRPHPLMKATIKSMRPEILAEYEATEKEYIEEAWGIYDDTADLDRAIVCSDAYYGDMSSVVWLYRATGKNIMIEGYLMVDTKGYPYAYSFLKNHMGEFFFVDGHYGAIEKLSPLKKNAELVAVLPRDFARNRFAYSYMDKIGDELYIFPAQESYVLHYCAQKKKFQKVVEFPNGYSKYRRILTSFCNQGVHIYLPLQSDHILVYREKDDKWDTMTEWFSLLQPYLKRSQEKIDSANDILEKNIFTDACQVESDIYIAVPLGHCVLHLNIMTKKSEILQIGEKDSIYYGIAYTGKSFWLTKEGNKLVRWQPSSRQYEEVALPLSREEKTSYHQIFFDGKQLILFPKERGTILHINPETKKAIYGPKIEQPLVYAHILGDAQYGWIEFGWIRDEIEPCVEQYCTFCLYAHGEVKKYPIRGEDIEKKQDPVQFAYQGIYYENIGCTIKTLLQRKSVQAQTDDFNHGGLIYKSLCKRI